MSAAAARHDAGPLRRALARLLDRRPARWSVAWLAAVSVLAVLVPVLPLAAPAEVRLQDRLRSPSVSDSWRGGFDAELLREPGAVTRLLAGVRESVFGDRMLGPVLGTDDLGRCLLSRVLWGARLSLAVALVASALSLGIGVAVGAAAGWKGGRTDTALMRLVDVLYSLPLMFLVIFVVALLRGLRKTHPELAVDPTVALFAMIGLVSWLTMARVVRAEVMALKTQAFVDAAILSGLSPAGIFRRHLLPNVLPLAVVTLTLTIPRVMLLEAFLSFLGLGVEAPDVSWGLLARQGHDALTAVHASWWLIAVPGVAIALTLLAFNVLGDALRDALDPRI